MSLLISDTISDIQLETQTVGVRISNDDIILGFKRANEYLNSNFKMPTTERETDLLVFTGVYEYPKPTDFLGWYEPKRPYGNVSPWFVNTTENELVHTYAGRQTAFKFDRENQFLLVSDSSGQNVNINECDSLTDNGTVVLSGDGSNLILDKQIFVSGNGSFRFLVTPSSGTTTITITGQSAVDITDYIDSGFAFLNLECPSNNTSAVTSVAIRLGSDASNYYQFSATARYRGDSILNGWGAIGGSTLDKTTTGTPDYTAIDYVQVIITGGGAGIYRLDSIFMALPTYYQLPYYSKYNVKASDNTYKQHPTALDDTILCPEDTNNAFVFRCLEHLLIYNLKDQGGGTYFANLAVPYENTLMRKYPNQERRIQSQYYRSPNRF